MGIGWIINIVFIGTMSIFPTSGQSETPAGLLWQELVGAANGHFEAGHYGSAEESRIRALRVAESIGPEDTRVTATLNNLAPVSEKLGRYTAAEAHYRKCLSIWEKIAGPEHSSLSLALNNLARLQSLRRGASTCDLWPSERES
jgi:tetratricopeptide (TPR) repeat protein